VHFVIHAVDRADALTTRAKHYREHRIHLDRAGDHGVSVMTAGTLVAFTDSDPYHVNRVWEHVEVHYYRKKR
jgi:uncharacterized protein YciI